MRVGCVPPYTGGGFLIQNGSIVELQTGPTDHLSLVEFYLLLQPNNQGGQQISFGLGVPAARGTGINASTLLAEDGGLTDSLPGVSVFTQWSTQPTQPTNYLRRASFNGAFTTNGQFTPFRFRFANGLRIAASSSLVIWQISTGYSFALGPGQFDLGFVLED